MRTFVHSFKRQSSRAKLQLIVVVGFILFAIVFSQMLNYINERPAPAPAEERTLLVETVEVVPETLPLTIQATGTVRVRTRVNVVPEVGGRVIKVFEYFRDGGTFEAKQPLFHIEPKDYALSVRQLQANVKTAQTNLALEQAEAQAARVEWQSLNPGKPIPTLVARAPQLRQAEASVASAKAQLENAQLDLSRTTYTLPFAGRVITSDITEGQFLQAGQSYGEVYAKDALEIQVPVAERLLQWFDGSGHKATISTKRRGKELQLAGEIVRVSGALDQATRFAYLVVQPVSDAWQELVPGLFADVTLIGPTMPGLWRIPNDAVQEGSAVWVVTEENRLARQPLDILTVHDDYTLTQGNGSTLQLVKGRIEGVGEGVQVRTRDDIHDNKKP